MPRYKLGVVAIFRDEAHILKEWINHYKRQGVDHFYLLNHESQDDYASQLDPCCEVLDYHQQFQQVRGYNHYLAAVKEECTWVMVVDLDEFMFAPDGRKIPDVLKDFAVASAISVPWVNFGSSGLIQQPDSIIKNFVMRWEYKGQQTLCKTVVRTETLEKLNIHTHHHSGSCVSSCGGWVDRSKISLSEGNLDLFKLRINHYPIQSREFFQQVKMKRGSITGPENVRDMSYFKRYDKNEIRDNLLCRLSDT